LGQYWDINEQAPQKNLYWSILAPQKNPYPVLNLHWHVTGNTPQKNPYSVLSLYWHITGNTPQKNLILHLVNIGTLLEAHLVHCDVTLFLLIKTDNTSNASQGPCFKFLSTSNGMSTGTSSITTKFGRKRDVPLV